MAERKGGGREVVRVVYARADEQICVDVPFEDGITVAQVVARSRLSTRFPDIAQRPLACAIYGQVAPLTRVVRAGDRVEILRPLMIDPKEGRRQAAARAKVRRT